MDLVIYPDPVLRKRASPLPEVDPALEEKIREMFEILYREKGVGLAAPQVGWSVRLFVVNTSGEPNPELERVYINPEITEASGEILEEEGCLSIPGVRGRVARYEQVRVKALDLQGQPIDERVTDLHARVIQHELDHLDGILFVSRLGTTERMRAAKTLKQLEKEFKQRTGLRA